MTEIPTEALEAGTVAVHDVDCPDAPGCPATQTTMARYRKFASAAISAAAPYLIAEGRRQAAEAIRAAAEREEQPVIPTRAGTFIRDFTVPEWAARIAELRGR